MTTASAPHPAVVALPPKAITAEDWQPHDHGRFYRYFEGETRDITTGVTTEETLRGVDVSVYAGGAQWDDGRIEDGTTDTYLEAPTVYTSEIRKDGIRVDGLALSADAARRLADLLVMAADEVDGWVAR